MTGRPLPCEEARSLLDEGLDRRLDPGEEEALRAHLALCAACRGAAEELAAVDAALLGMDPGDPGPPFSDRVIAALDRAPGVRVPPRPARVRLLRGLVAAAGTAAFAALGSILLPLEAAASTVGVVLPEIPAPPLPDLAAFLPFHLPAWAAAAGALLAAAGAAVPVVTLRRGAARP